MNLEKNLTVKILKYRCYFALVDLHALQLYLAHLSWVGFGSVLMVEITDQVAGILSLDLITAVMEEEIIEPSGEMEEVVVVAVEEEVVVEAEVAEVEAVVEEEAEVAAVVEDVDS